MKDQVASRSCSTLEELKLQVDRYMHDYNHHRHQWEGKKMPPVQHRNHLLSVA
ncbi:IS3 family transposase [Cohnella sp. JJ-181]|uniref:IS3 family transposase n=1 Tax=Cohnella rhizoplanae TaxID=2974897 RepID=UPI0023310233|nr:IS3 family transposase [Cohnella sp. JJ-181]